VKNIPQLLTVTRTNSDFIAPVSTVFSFVERPQSGAFSWPCSLVNLDCQSVFLSVCCMQSIINYYSANTNCV